MKMIWQLVIMLVAMDLQSADILKELECHDQVVKDGVENLILPKQVESLVGATNVDHFISSFGSKLYDPVWNSVGYFENRYVITLQVPIVIDYKNCKLLGAKNSAMVVINEVTNVTISTSGTVGAKMRGQWNLNENQWKWLVENKGDWSVVKVPIRTNAPVKGFDKFEKAARAPIRDRKQGFDDPIRKTFEELKKQGVNEREKNNKDH